MSYSAYDVVDYMQAHPGVSAADAKRALDDPVILDPVERYTKKHTDPAYIFAEVMNGVDGLLSTLYNISEANSAWSKQEAGELRSWQERMMTNQMIYNAQEAGKNREWQQMMSNTAHQREIADLKAAGLNPVLSAMNGNGASVGSGASASVSLPSGAMGQRDTSANTAIVNLLASMLSAQTQLANTAVSAFSNQAIADKNNSMSKYVADITTSTSYQNALLSYLASKYGSDSSRIANEYAAQMAYASSIYGSNMQEYIAKNYPNSLGAGLARGLPGTLGFDNWRDLGISAGAGLQRAWDNLVDTLAGKGTMSTTEAINTTKEYMAKYFGNAVADQYNYGGYRNKDRDTQKRYK